MKTKSTSKKLLAMLITALMVLGMLPVTAFAVDTLPCTVYIDDNAGGSVAYTEPTEDATGGWALTYDETNGVVLTLSGFDGSYIESTGNLNIMLDGENALTKPAAAQYGINVKDNLVIKAKTSTAIDKLNVLCTDNTASDAALVRATHSNGANMTVESGTVTVQGNTGYGVELNNSEHNSFYVKNDAVLSVTASNIAVNNAKLNTQTCGSITLKAGNAITARFDASGSGTVTFEGTSPTYPAVAAKDKEFVVNSTAGDIIVKNVAVNRVDLREGKAVTDNAGNLFNYLNGGWKSAGDGYAANYIVDENKELITELKVMTKEEIPFEWMIPGSFFSPDESEWKVGVSYNTSSSKSGMLYAVRSNYAEKQSIYLSLDPTTPLPEGVSFGGTSISGTGYFFGTPTAEAPARTVNIIAQRRNGWSNGNPVYVGDPIVLEIPFPAVVMPPREITVDGTNFDEKTPSKSGTGWSWAYDDISKSGTLTLSGYNGSYIESTGDLNIVLDGENTLTKTNATKHGIKVQHNLTIKAKNSTAADKLNVTCTSSNYGSYLIYQEEGTATIDSGTVNLLNDFAGGGGFRAYGVTVNNDAVLFVTTPGDALNLAVLNANSSGEIQLKSRYMLTNGIEASGSGTIKLEGTNVASPAVASGRHSITVNSTAGDIIMKNVAVNRLDLREGKAVVDNAGNYINYFNGSYKDLEYINKNYVVDENDELITDLKIVSKTDIPFEWMIPGSYFSPKESEWKAGTDYNTSNNRAEMIYALRNDYTEDENIYLSLDPTTPLPEGVIFNGTSVYKKGYFSGTPTAETPASTVRIIAQRYTGNYYNPTFVSEPIVLEIPIPAVTVDKPVNCIALSDDSIILDINDSETLSYTITPEDATIQSVSWSSDNSEIATAESGTGDTGIVYGKKAGKTIITVATTQGNQQDTCTVYVREATPNPIYDMTHIINLVANAAYTVAADGGTAQPYTADSNGKISILNEWRGKALSIVKTNAEANCNSTPVTVNIPELVKIRIETNPTKTSYKVGETVSTAGLKVMAVYSDESETDVTASVTVTGFDSSTVGNRTATVEFEGKTATFNYVVTENIILPTPTVKINNNPGSRTINYGEGILFNATATDLPEGAKIVWFVNDKKAGEGASFKFTDANADTTITVKIVDKDGNVMKDATDGEISASEKITVKAGFFQKLISFFKNLFKINRIIAQSVVSDK